MLSGSLALSPLSPPTVAELLDALGLAPVWPLHMRMVVRALLAFFAERRARFDAPIHEWARVEPGDSGRVVICGWTGKVTPLGLREVYELPAIRNPFGDAEANAEGSA